MKSHKNLCTVLLLSLVLSMASCGTTTVETDTTAAETEPIVTETETIDPNKDDLPDGLDYEGYSFRVLTYEGGNIENTAWRSYIDVNETVGEVLNDAAFERNNIVEERLNVTIDCIEQGEVGDTVKLLSASVMAGQDEYDYTIFFSTQTMYSLVTDGYLSNVYDLGYVDLEKPYYLRSLTDTFTIYDKLFFLTGDAVCTMRGSSYIFYNVPLWQEYHLEDPYEIVRDGKWTLDKCFSMIEGTYVDVNGDGKKDIEDRYGIIGIPTTMGYCFLSGDGSYFRVTDDGYETPMTSEHNLSLVDKMLYHMENTDAYFGSDSDNALMVETFKDGRALMFYSGSSVTILREMEFQSGLLPFPKYDEAQDDYYSVMAGGLTVVPVTISDPDRTGAILEALNSASANTVKQAFYQQYVENKVLQDEGSQEMFELILENGRYDFTYYIDASKAISNRALIVSQLAKRQNNLVSAWEGIKASVTNAYDEFFANMK